MAEDKDLTPLISVLLPTFNSEDYVEETIKSVLSQTYSNLELIIVDDCSSDNTMAVITAVTNGDERVFIKRLAENSGGPAHPRNVGISIAKGSFIAFIDSDDLWHREKLSIQLNEMQKHGFQFTSTRVVPFGEHEAPPFSAEVHRASEHELISAQKLLKKNVFANSGVMLSAELAKSLRFSEQKRHAAVEDYLAWIELLSNNDVQSARLGHRLIYYRLRKSSISRSKMEMAKKVFSLLGEIRIQGQALGIKRFWYFANYVIGAFSSKMYT